METKVRDVVGLFVGHDTVTLFAALEIATGRVTDACYQHHRNEEFLDFLKKLARA